VPKSANTVHIDSHGVATLRYIRDSWRAAAVLRGAGSAGIALGVIGLLACGPFRGAELA